MKAKAQDIDSGLVDSLGPRLCLKARKQFVANVMPIIGAAVSAKPTRDHRGAVDNLMVKCAALEKAIDWLHREIPENDLRLAWALVSNDPFPADLRQTLRRLRRASRHLLPDAKPSNRPKTGGIAEFVITKFAAEYEAVFRKPPGLGGNSPFIRFCFRTAGIYGFDCPTVPTISRILRPKRG